MNKSHRTWLRYLSPPFYSIGTVCIQKKSVPALVLGPIMNQPNFRVHWLDLQLKYYMGAGCDVNRPEAGNDEEH